MEMEKIQYTEVKPSEYPNPHYALSILLTVSIARCRHWRVFQSKCFFRSRVRMAIHGKYFANQYHLTK